MEGIDEKRSGWPAALRKGPATGEKPSIAGNAVLPHLVIFREGHQSTKGSAQRGSKGHFSVSSLNRIRRGLQHGSQQTGERNLEETETTKRGGKTSNTGESQYPVLLKIFKKGAGARKRRCGTEDAMEKESSENKKACLEIKCMKN